MEKGKERRGMKRKEIEEAKGTEGKESGGRKEWRKEKDSKGRHGDDGRYKRSVLYITTGLLSSAREFCSSLLLFQSRRELPPLCPRR